MAKVLDLSSEEVVQALRQGKITICVVGLGYVGLPTAMSFAAEGVRVIGCVRTQSSALRINRGETPIIERDITSLLREGAVMLDASCPNCGIRFFKLKKETFCPYCGRLASITEFGVHLEDKVAAAYERVAESQRGLQELLKRALETGRFYATTDTINAVQKSDIAIITVGTPVNEKNIPDYTDLENACHAVGKGLQRDSLVILKSTVSPRTTENFVKPILEKESGMEAGKDFGLAFMPETIFEGHALYQLRTLPKIVGGITQRCAQAAANIFSVFPAPVHIYENPSIVEAAKLFMNIYRDVNIALVNELAMICEKLGVNVIRAISAANVEPKTHLLTPGLVGGYCLPKDTYYLARPAEKAGYRPSLISLARKLNDTMPSHIVDLVNEALEEINVPIKGARVAVLGLGFKANSGDLRNTPAKPVIEDLLKQGAHVIAQDPFVRFDEVTQILPNITCTRSIEEAVREATCTVIATDHLEYRGLTARYLKGLMTKPCAIVDARHIIDPKEAALSEVTFRGLGKPRA